MTHLRQKTGKHNMPPYCSRGVKCPLTPTWRHLHHVLSLKIQQKCRSWRTSHFPTVTKRTSSEGISRHLGLKLGVNDVEFECRGLRTVRWHHTSRMEACYLVSLRLELWSTVSSVVMDSALILFTPETPEVFCGLKHFTHPSIFLVVSR